MIEKNTIENTSLINNFTHDGKQLYAKPFGTYFFRHNDHGNLVLVFSAGGTKIGLLQLEYKEKNIKIISKGYEQTFESEESFLHFSKNQGLRCPAFPNKVIKLTHAISELNQSVKPLKYLTGMFITSNQALSQKVWEAEDDPLALPEELEDYLFDLEEQRNASKVLNGPRYK